MGFYFLTVFPLHLWKKESVWVMVVLVLKKVVSQVQLDRAVVG